MNSFPPDNIPAPHEGQPDRFAATPLPGAGPAEPLPEFSSRPEFETQQLTGRPLRANSRTPFRGIDLVYLVLFYFIAGGVLTVIVAAGAFVFFGISPAALRSSTADWASVLIISQALLSGATLIFLYTVVRGRSAAPFWQTMGWRGFRNMASSGSVMLRYVFGGFALADCYRFRF